MQFPVIILLVVASSRMNIQASVLKLPANETFYGIWTFLKTQIVSGLVHSQANGRLENIWPTNLHKGPPNKREQIMSKGKKDRAKSEN